MSSEPRSFSVAFLLSMKVSSGMALGFRMRNLGSREGLVRRWPDRRARDDYSQASQRLAQRLQRGPTEPAWRHGAGENVLLKKLGLRLDALFHYIR